MTFLKLYCRTAPWNDYHRIKNRLYMHPASLIQFNRAAAGGSIMQCSSLDVHWLKKKPTRDCINTVFEFEYEILSGRHHYIYCLLLISSINN